MKNLPSRFLITLLVACALARPLSAASGVHWISSTEAKPWQELPVDAVPSSNVPALKLDPHVTYQVIDGFGGCFNDLGWQALLALNEPKREAALKALFDPHGANFTLGRMGMGANDFSLAWYSFDETPGDYAMQHFSIERDREYLIPYIKAAMKYQPQLGIWGVPWSPPEWMKTSDHYKGGRMKQDARTLAAYALYFSKYVQAYRAAGVHVFAVMPQNEPNYYDGIYPQCGWSGEELDGFLRDHLLPRLKKDGVKVEVWLGTIADGKMENYVDPVLGDPATNAALAGVGFQYGGQNALLETHAKYPGHKLAQTETECFNGANAWSEGMETFGKIIADTNHFAGSYFFWNMILNESGLSTWNWRQNSLLTVDRKTDSVRYNPEFYAMKHFSATVLPGAKRIAVNGGPFSDIVAFLNPDGSRVVLFANKTAQPLRTAIEAGGSLLQFTVPARSMNTVMLGEP